MPPLGELDRHLAATAGAGNASSGPDGERAGAPGMLSPAVYEELRSRLGRLQAAYDHLVAGTATGGEPDLLTVLLDRWGAVLGQLDWVLTALSATDDLGHEATDRRTPTGDGGG